MIIAVLVHGFYREFLNDSHVGWDRLFYLAAMQSLQEPRGPVLPAPGLLLLSPKGSKAPTLNKKDLRLKPGPNVTAACPKFTGARCVVKFLSNEEMGYEVEWMDCKACYRDAILHSLQSTGS